MVKHIFIGLSIFLFSTTILPKRVWYDLLTSHHHHNYSADEDNRSHFNAYCDCNEQVAQGVYLYVSTPIFRKISTGYIVFANKPSSFIILFRASNYLKRGPPTFYWDRLFTA